MDDIALFSMLRSRLGYLNERQRVISQNVANANSPGFVPKDLKPFSFEAQVKAASMTAAVTQPGHISTGATGPGSASAGVKEVKSPDSEQTLDGNSVVLEEEMLKMTDARMNYDAAITFYQKSLSLLRMAARAPGR